MTEPALRFAKAIDRVRGLVSGLARRGGLRYGSARYTSLGMTAIVG